MLAKLQPLYITTRQRKKRIKAISLNAGCESTSCTVNMKIRVQKSIDSIISAVITCNIAKTIVSFDTKIN